MSLAPKLGAREGALGYKWRCWGLEGIASTLLKLPFVALSVPPVLPLALSWFLLFINRPDQVPIYYTRLQSIYRSSNYAGMIWEESTPSHITLPMVLAFLTRETLRTSSWLMFSLNEQWEANMNKLKKSMNMAWPKVSEIQ